MDIYALVRGALDTIARQADLDLTLTDSGKKKFGNRTLRLTYRQNHLVIKCQHRYDLEQFPESRAAYIHELNTGAEFPWLQLPDVDKYSLKNIPGTVNLDASKHLTASVKAAELLYEALTDAPRHSAYLRKWQAGNGGVGIELLLLTETEVFEISINHYAKPAIEVIAETMVKLA